MELKKLLELVEGLIGCIGKQIAIYFKEKEQLCSIVGTLEEIRITEHRITFLVKGGYTSGYSIPLKENSAKIGALITEIRYNGNEGKVVFQIEEDERINTPRERP